MSRDLAMADAARAIINTAPTTPTLMRVVDRARQEPPLRAIDFEKRRARTPRSQRLMAAILFVDMVGYSRQMHEDEDTAYRARTKYRHVLSIVLRMYDGELIQHYGDGALALFPSAVQSVRAGIELQRRLRNEPPVSVRVGIHVADVVRDSMGVYGDGVNIAARIEGLCPVGGILVSQQVHRELLNHRGLESVPAGAFALKNIAAPIAVYGISHPDLAKVTRRSLDQRRPTCRRRARGLTAAAILLGAIAGFILGFVI